MHPNFSNTSLAEHVGAAPEASTSTIAALAARFKDTNLSDYIAQSFAQMEEDRRAALKASMDAILKAAHASWPQFKRQKAEFEAQQRDELRPPFVQAQRRTPSKSQGTLSVDVIVQVAPMPEAEVVLAALLEKGLIVAHDMQVRHRPLGLGAGVVIPDAGYLQALVQDALQIEINAEVAGRVLSLAKIRAADASALATERMRLKVLAEQ